MLTNDEPPARALTGAGWWIGAALTLAIPVFTFFRLQHLVDAPYKARWWLPRNITTGIMFCCTDSSGRRPTTRR